jgi:putative alpha-1,2-mannosidase
MTCGPNLVLTSTIPHFKYNHSLHLTFIQFVPQDNARLIELQGGADDFIERLDFIIDNVSIKTHYHNLTTY